MLAIFTRFIGPTNFRGSRVVARTASGRRVTLPWDHAKNPSENHAVALAESAGWSVDLAYGGETLDKRGNVYVVVVRRWQGGGATEADRIVVNGKGEPK